MGRVSTKADKTIYQQAREKLGLTRAKASELTFIDANKIVRIENEKTQANPWDVVAMVTAYKEPLLCNHYCSNECPIGREKVPEIKPKDLAQVILEMLASLNSIQKRTDRLIEITADGKIKDDEIEDFIRIQKELEQISITVEALKLWTEKMVAEGKIDVEKYNRALKKKF